MDGIKIEVTGNIARVVEKPRKITAGTVGLPVEVSFDSQWDGLYKEIVFRAGCVCKVVAVAIDMVVPWEVLKTPGAWLSIGAYGANEDGTIVIPTIWVNVCPVSVGTNTDGDTPEAPTPDLYSQILAGYSGLMDSLSAHIKNTSNPHSGTALQVGARPDTWMPTAAEVGAAPAGYGLGTTGQMANDWDTAVKSGFFYGKTNSPDGGWWAGAVYGNAAKYAFQHLFKSGNPSIQKVRELVNGSWGAWIDCGPSAFAPAGYGLGENAAACPNSDCNQAVNSGWYTVSGSNTVNGPGENGVMLVLRRNSSCIWQYHFSYSANPSVRRRMCISDAWYAWEWINPPMVPGVEYRTTERWRGKPVYAKMIDFGAMPNKTTAFLEFDNRDLNVISLEGTAYTATETNRFPVFFSAGGLAAYCYSFVYNGTTRVYINALADTSSYNATFVVKYTEG